MGLRLKFHLVLLPTVLLALGVMLAADYRYQLDALMEAHAHHASAVAGGSARLDAAAEPDAVADRSLRSHALYGVLLLVLLIVAADGALTLLVLRPTATIRAQLSRLERGQWHLAGTVQPRDELGALCAAFQRLGPELGALMTNALNAERLATTALVSTRLTARIEPEVQKIARTAAALLQRPMDPRRYRAGRRTRVWADSPGAA